MTIKRHRRLHVHKIVREKKKGYMVQREKKKRKGDRFCTKTFAHLLSILRIFY